VAGFPSLIDVGQRRTPADVAQITKTGFGRMPAFDRIPDPQREAILEYVLGKTSSSTSRPDEVAAASTSASKVPPYAFGGFRRWTDQSGYPAIKPPWGTLNAVDLNTGELKWKVPLGEYQELSEMGIPPTGTQLFGGGIVTAGGLVFIGASRDEKFRAFDKDTGEILWEFQLPAGGYATPATYQVEGEQFVVIAAGGGGFQGTKTGDYYLAFKLAADHR
jgi:quinoprotein glucose dehydrogenase